MLTAVKLVDQWGAIERRLPRDWESVALRLRTEQPEELSEAARILAPMTVGRVGDHLAFTVRRAGGPSGPEAARRLFRRLDEARIWCLLEQAEIDVAAPDLGDARRGARGVAAPRAGTRRSRSFRRTGARSSASSSSGRAPSFRVRPWSVPRSTRRVTGNVSGFTFRCARRAGYGVSPEMARRCFERLDEEGIPGAVSVLRLVSDADNVATQGAVWYVGGKAL